MPINYKGKDYDFAELEEHIKKTKPGIESPGGYVKRIEENQHKAQQLRARLGKINQLFAYQCADCGEDFGPDLDKLQSHRKEQHK